MGLAAGVVLALPAAARGATVTTFPVPTADAGLAGIAKAPDGSLWVTEHAARKLVRVALDGSMSEVAVPNRTAGSSDTDRDIGPTDIVADAGGTTMDFLTDIGSSVGFVTLDGAVRTFHDGSDNAQSISAAQGGGVWEVFYLSSRSPELNAALVRADGTFGGFAGTSKIGYSPMATGPDGRMSWGDGGDAIRSYSEAAAASGGAPQDVPLPPADQADDVTSLAFDAAGTLHYTQYDTGDGHPQLARGGLLGTVSGGVASSVDLGGDYLPRSMVLGPDGALWWAEHDGLGRLDPSGAIQHASLGAYDPVAIAFGGDGALWFADANANRVGRVAIDAALFPPAPTAPPAAGAPATTAPVTTPTRRAPAITLRTGAQRLATARRRRLIRITGSLAGAGSLSVAATIPASTARHLGLRPRRGATTQTLATASHRFVRAGSATLTLKLGTKARAALRRSRRSLVLTLRATSRQAGAVAVTTTTHLTLRR